jgi:shikimate dehydrogenase
MIRACCIGWPVTHVRSPLIHGFWLKRYGIDGAYGREAVEPGGVADFLRSLGDRGLAGCNVTIPHKEAAFAAMDEVDPGAVAVGAVNTVWLDGGRLVGMNSDVDRLPEEPRPAGARLGERGRPCRSSSAPAVPPAASSTAFSRAACRSSRWRIDPGRKGRGHRRRPSPRRPAARLGGPAEGCSAMPTSSSTPPPSAWSASRRSTCRSTGLKPSAIVSDIVYVPLETDLLARAAARGHRTVEGLGMLLHQAVPGFARWFGVTPEVTAELHAHLAADIRGH